MSTELEARKSWENSWREQNIVDNTILHPFLYCCDWVVEETVPFKVLNYAITNERVPVVDIESSNPQPSEWKMKVEEHKSIKQKKWSSISAKCKWSTKIEMLRSLLTTETIRKGNDHKKEISRKT